MRVADAPFGERIISRMSSPRPGVVEVAGIEPRSRVRGCRSGSGLRVFRVRAGVARAAVVLNRHGYPHGVRLRDESPESLADPHRNPPPGPPSLENSSGTTMIRGTPYLTAAATNSSESFAPPSGPRNFGQPKKLIGLRPVFASSGSFDLCSSESKPVTPASASSARRFAQRNTFRFRDPFYRARKNRDLDGLAAIADTAPGRHRGRQQREYVFFHAEIIP